MALPGRRILVLYGSETGNSQEKAGDIDRMCRRLRFHTELEEMDDVKLNTLLQDYELVVFVISTTGQGQFPKNARNFWKSLRRARLPPNCLATVRFTTFGLGDSSYQKFNWASRLLRSRLLRLGAQEVVPLGEADERHDNGVDSIYQPWVQSLKDYFLSAIPLPAGIQPIPDNERLTPRYSLHILPEKRMGATETPVGVDQIGASADRQNADEERRFQADKEKNAALSHTERPRSSYEQTDEDYDRQKQYVGGAFLGRHDQAIADIVLRGSRVDILDKANILKDAPEKYLLHRPAKPALPLDFPPEAFLPIPNAITAVVRSNHRVTPPGHWQDVRLLTLDITAPTYESKELTTIPGDVIALYPKNYPEDVQKLIDMMDWKEVADKPVAFERGHVPKGLYASDGATLRDILIHNIDFTAVPTRTFLEKLADFATHPDHEQKLRELTKPNFSQEFYDFTSRPRRTIFEVLAEFYSAKVPVSHVPDIFPVIRPREYSIANNSRPISQNPVPAGSWAGLALEEHGADWNKSKTEQTGTVTFSYELLIALVEYKTIIRKPRQGLCSRYVKHLPAGTVLQITRGGETRPPDGSLAAQRPLVAIATGTGIAPIRSLIHERTMHESLAESLLFFGCRNQDADFYFHDEWIATPRLTVVPAFSRDPKVMSQLERDLLLKLDQKVGNVMDAELRKKVGLPPHDVISTGKLSYDYDQGKNYVQQMIRRHAHYVCWLLAQNAIVCLCGSSGRMPQSVREALRDAVIMGGLCANAAEADQFLFDEKNAKITFWEEAW